jgi:hypothetical protein
MHMISDIAGLKQKTLQPLDNPFGMRLSPMSWVRSVTYLFGLDTRRMAETEGFEPSIGLYNPITV